MPELLGRGRTADVYALDAGRVRRCYRDGSSGEHEAEIMRYVADLGYPVPAVFSVAGPEIVMERVDGPTMVAAIIAGDLSLDDAMRMLASLHTELHALPGGIIHLDLHAENVLMSPRGPIVIDWQNATEGPADFDVALSALIMAEVAVDPSHPLSALVAPAVPAFLGYAGRPSPEMIERALATRLRNPTLSSSEKSRLPSAARLLS